MKTHRGFEVFAGTAGFVAALKAFNQPATEEDTR